ncbi:WSC-domain-containing protein [Stipitochalara longipes BDJ]|nr:WSC-domain-containing protein [Stipitochalara longipes BDJ]
MKFSRVLFSLLLNHISQQAWALDPTDSIMHGDLASSNYLPNHNINPNTISSFGQLWKFAVPASSNGLAEQFQATPLVYTPSSTGVQVVLAFSMQNKIYSLDAVNGTLYASRDLSTDGEVPFLASDLPGCYDITPLIGITGTPVIDPSSDTVYFWAKSYGTPSQSGLGWANGAYRFHAIDAVTLQERPGFPVALNGHPADNDGTRLFTGGNHMQRTGLSLVNGAIYAGFASHCDFYNYTGWAVGMSTSGTILTAYATMGGPGATPQDGTWNGGGGGGGIWMGGAAIASDRSDRIFFTTGNGLKARDNGDIPSSGRIQLDTLSEAIVNLAINSTTKALTQQDYFEPAAYLAMDQVDIDLGSGGLVLPDESVFRGPGISGIAIACGKNSVCFVVNRDNLGGYKMGSGGGDAIIQAFSPPSGEPIWQAGGTYPLEGGYFYLNPANSPTYVYSLGFTGGGLPSFTLAAKTTEIAPANAGVGPPVITTYQGQPGTAILWVCDPNNRLRAYYAVPQNGTMVRITLPAAPAINKFQRPAFGNGRYYLASNNGVVYGYGSPSSMPLTCNSLNFGSVLIGNSSSMTITCTVKTPVTVLGMILGGGGLFQSQNSSLPSAKLAAGSTFNFSVIFNLTKYTSSPAVQTAVLNLLTNNTVAGFSTEVPISVTGKAASNNPILSMSPLQVSFPGLVVPSALSNAGSASSLIISNLGQNAMNITGYAFATGTYTNSPNSPVTNVTFTNGSAVLDAHGYFTSSDLPPVGTIIQGGASVTVDLLFNTTVLGSYFSTFIVYTNGGSSFSVLTASATSPSIALFQWSNGTSPTSWTTIPDCASATAGCTININMGTSSGIAGTSVVLSFTNEGGSALTIDKSKPPIGGAIFAQNPDTELTEVTQIAPNASATATVLFQPAPPILNSPNVQYSALWTLNVNDENFGVHVVNFTGTVVSKKAGPITANGNALYQYLGCYQDNVDFRIEPQGYQNPNVNTNGLCQNQSHAAGAVFAGSEYVVECWVGNVIPNPSSKVSDALCNYQCAGDSTQICGGNGGYISIYYDSSRYFPANGTIIGTSGKGPALVPTIGNYSYQGCYLDTANPRPLTGIQLQNNGAESLEACAKYCTGYTYFGTEYGQECYCGNTLGYATVEPWTDCYMLCTGNSTEYCGAGNRLSLYMHNSSLISTSSSVAPTSTSSTKTYSSTVLSTTTSLASSTSLTSSTTSSASPTATGVGGYGYVGCQTDAGVGDRTLSSTSFTDTSMTVEVCSSFCGARGYTYFGVEYSTECYCGNTLGTSTTATDGRCNMACGGSATEICGGPGGLSLYKFSAALPSATASAPLPAYTYVGCQSDSPTARTLLQLVVTSPAMTVELCTSFCAGYAYFGIEYSDECYCGNTLEGGSGIVTDGRCSMTCAGNTTEICGGSNGLSLYQLAPVVSSSSTLSSSTKSLSSSLYISTTSSNLAPTLSSVSSTSSTLSSSSTLTTSSSQLPTSTSSVLTQSTSSAVSSSSTSSVSASPTPALKWTVGAYSFQGCYTDSTTSRALTAVQIINYQTMTLETCAGICTGYTYMAVEYWGECYCGNTLTGGSSNATITDCSYVCPGNPTEYCGAANRLELYKLSSAVTAPTVSSSVQASSSSASSSSSSKSSPSPSSSTSTSSSQISTSSPTTTSTKSSSVATALLSTSSSQVPSSSSTIPSATTSTTSSSTSSSKLSTTTASSLLVSASSTSSKATSTSTSTQTSTKSSSTSTWSYAGCANDTTTNRALNGLFITGSSTMTVESCQAYCISNNYPVAGLEYGQECWCGISLFRNSVLGQTGCNAPCTGNSSETCGGTNRLSVYTYNKPYTPAVVPAAVGAYNLKGCYTDVVATRGLSAYTVTSTTMTNEVCVSTCQSKGYSYASTEYASQCYCGNSIGSTSVPTSITDCTGLYCAGNSTEFCGDGLRMLVYSTK